MTLHGISSISRRTRRPSPSEFSATSGLIAVVSESLALGVDLTINKPFPSTTTGEVRVADHTTQGVGERVGTDPQRSNGLLHTNITPSQRGLCDDCASIDWRAALIRNIKPSDAVPERPDDSPIVTQISDRRWEEFELGSLKTYNRERCSLCDLIARGLEEILSAEPQDNIHREKDEDILLLGRCENPSTKPAPWPAKSLEYPETFGKLRLKIRFQGIDYIKPSGKTDFPDLEFSVVNDISGLTGDPYSEKTVKKLAKPFINPTQIDMETLKIWTQQCRLDHAQCRAGWQGIVRSSAAPKRGYTLRVIDCSTMNVVLAKSHCRYAALSYVWGRAEQYSSRKQDLRSSQEDPNSEFISLENIHLPKTIQDAIIVCKEISIRYLWVDTLCIIQDDMEEKKRSLSAMDQIYKAALLTIVAASGTHADAGLAGVRPGSRNTNACEGWLDGMHLRRVNKYDAEASIEDTPWSKRGWTYQESYFSSRKLIFANDRVYYHCSESSFGETDPTNKACFRKPIFHGRSSSDRDLKTLRTTPSGPFEEYAMHVENYNWRTLSFQNDVLVAFAGVASDLERATDKRMRLFQGLPVGFFHRALCWETKNPQQSTESTRRCDLDMQPILPTWTWAAWNRAIHYTHQYFFNDATQESDQHTCWYSFSFPWMEGAEYQLTDDISEDRKQYMDRWVADTLRTGTLTFYARVGMLNKNQLNPKPHIMDDGTVWEQGEKHVVSVAQVFREKTKFGGNAEHLHFVLFLREENGVYYREGGSWMSNSDWEEFEHVRKTVHLH